MRHTITRMTHSRIQESTPQHDMYIWTCCLMLAFSFHLNDRASIVMIYKCI
jgi:hypothetical protein